MQDDWKTYRTRFVVRARRLGEPFTFTDTNGHAHHGRPGDYVIESRDGLRISRREIFEDVYVAMESAETLPSCSPDREATDVQPGGHSFRACPERQSAMEANGCRESNSPLIGALAPVQPPAEPVNLLV